MRTRKDVTANLDKGVDFAFSKEGGISHYRAGFLLFCLSMLFSTSVMRFFEGLSYFKLNDYFFYYLIIGIVTMFFNNRIVYKNDKYKKYFKTFEKYQRLKKIKLAIFCIMTIVMFILFSYFSFVYLGYRMNNKG